MIEFRNINFRYAGGTDAGGLVNICLPPSWERFRLVCISTGPEAWLRRILLCA